jgi:hypothetical protein
MFEVSGTGSKSMNERIKELANQCRHEVEHFSIDNGYTYTEEFDEQKFAELIIQDCIGIGHEVGRNPFIEACQERSKIIKNIERHFGITE